MAAAPCPWSAGPASTKWKSLSGAKRRFRQSRYRPEVPSMPLLHAPPDPPGTDVTGQSPGRQRRPEQHHGGAWKVAYADFVTALMALFIVLWMMNSNDKVKQSVRGYFLDPRGYTRHL